MNISGKVVQVLPIQIGTSKAGNPWQKQEFILEQGGQYPRTASCARTTAGSHRSSCRPCATTTSTTNGSR